MKITQRLIQRIIQRIAAVAFAVGGAMLTATDWAALSTPQGVAGLLMAASGAVLGIYGQQPGHAAPPPTIPPPPYRHR